MIEIKTYALIYNGAMIIPYEILSDAKFLKYVFIFINWIN